MTATADLVQLKFTDEIAQAVHRAQHAIDRGQHTRVVGYDLVEAVGGGQLDASQQRDLGRLIATIRIDLYEGAMRNADEDFQQFKEILTRPNLSAL